jgi:hypothetical protein
MTSALQMNSVKYTTQEFVQDREELKHILQAKVASKYVRVMEKDGHKEYKPMGLWDRFVADLQNRLAARTNGRLFSPVVIEQADQIATAIKQRIVTNYTNFATKVLNEIPTAPIPIGAAPVKVNNPFKFRDPAEDPNRDFDAKSNEYSQKIEKVKTLLSNIHEVHAIAKEIQSITIDPTAHSSIDDLDKKIDARETQLRLQLQMGGISREVGKELFPDDPLYK